MKSWPLSWVVLAINVSLSACLLPCPLPRIKRGLHPTQRRQRTQRK